MTMQEHSKIYPICEQNYIDSRDTDFNYKLNKRLTKPLLTNPGKAKITTGELGLLPKRTKF